MKGLNLTTLILLIIGGINWGLVGIADFNLVAALFGTDSAISNLVYIIVGLSALWQLVPLGKAFKLNEPIAESNVHVAHPRR